MTQQNSEAKSYLKPFIFMVVLMALIGFITSLNQQFQAPLKITFLQGAAGYENSLSTMLNFTFFLAYLLIGPVASGFLNRHGYRATLLRGIRLVLYAMILFLLSTLLFRWVEAGRTLPEILNRLPMGGITLPLSFFVFAVGSFVSGSGLAFLQSAVNPYIVVCNVPHTTGVTRQNIGGTANSLMNTLTPLFVAFVVFSGKEPEAMQVQDMIFPFAGIVLLTALLYWGVQQVTLPDLTETRHEDDNVKGATLLRRFPHLTLGIVGLFMYVGCEVCIGSNIIHYAMGDLGVTYKTAAMWSMLYWLGMLVARFLSSFLSMIKAETQLLTAAGGAAPCGAVDCTEGCALSHRGRVVPLRDVGCCVCTCFGGRGQVCGTRLGLFADGRCGWRSTAVPTRHLGGCRAVVGCHLVARGYRGSVLAVLCACGTRSDPSRADPLRSKRAVRNPLAERYIGFGREVYRFQWIGIYLSDEMYIPIAEAVRSGATEGSDWAGW